jgi:hypothetical protein
MQPFYACFFDYIRQNANRIYDKWQRANVLLLASPATNTREAVKPKIKSCMLSSSPRSNL